MKIYYLDDSPEYREVLRGAVNKVSQQTSLVLTFEYLQPEGKNADFIYFNENNGEPIVDWDVIDRLEIGSRLCFKKSTLENLAKEPENFFIVDINFAPMDSPLLQLDKYGLWICKFLCVNGLPSSRIMLMTRYADEARRMIGSNKERYWCDQFDKKDFPTDDPETIDRLYHRLAWPLREKYTYAASVSADDLLSKINTRELRELMETAKRMKLVGESPEFLSSLISAYRFSKSSANVFISGESGTGKENMAKLIHALSNRYNKPFETVNCPAVAANLIESELFGHVKGAFTNAIKDKEGKFELADGGTIFLDEIAETSHEMQAKLLRTTQHHVITRVGDEKDIKIDVRIISATHQNLRQRNEAGLFREDLFHRLTVLLLHLPTLNERVSDIPVLVEFLVPDICKEDKNIKEKHIPKDVVLELMTLNYTGANIRVLRNLLTNLLVHGGDPVTVQDLRNIPQFKELQFPAQVALQQSAGESLDKLNEEICKRQRLKSFMSAFKSLIKEYDSKTDNIEELLLIVNFVFKLLEDAIYHPFSFNGTGDQYKRVTLALIKELKLENDLEITRNFRNLSPSIDLSNLNYHELLKKGIGSANLQGSVDLIGGLLRKAIINGLSIRHGNRNKTI